MKKLALFLAIVMLASSLLVACGGSGNDTSDAESAAVSADAGSTEDASSAAASEPSSEEQTSSAEESSEPAEVFEFASVVSVGKTYTSTVKAGDSYEDSYNSELTDGLFAPEAEVSYTEAKLSGYSAGAASGVDFVIDLEEVVSRVYGFEVSYLDTHEAGIAPPAKVDVYGSVDGEEWTSLGSATIFTGDERTMQKAVLNITFAYDARYIKFSIKKGSAWIFVDELSVIADVENNEAELKWKEGISNAYASETLTYTERQNLIQKISVGIPDRTLPRYAVTEGRSYTVSKKPLEAYPDPSGKKKLTDGESSGFYESGMWVGYEGGEEVTIDLSLLAERSDIACLELNAYNNAAVGISFPTCVTFYVSSDKKEWTEVGRIYAPTDNAQETFTYSLEFDKTIKAKHIRFVLAATDCKKFLIDEISAIVYNGDKSQLLLYPDVVFPEVKGDEFWDASEKDYNDKINLISGLPCQVSTVSEPEKDNRSNNTAVTSKVLTDGVFATENGIHNGKFFKFNLGGGRNIYFDLGKVSAMSEFTASFTNRDEWAVAAPATVLVTASDDGSVWYDIGTMKVDITSDNAICKGKLTLDKPVAARFVCFSFEVKTWAGIDELEVFGKKNASGAARLSSGGYNCRGKFFDDEYKAPSPDLLGGAADIYLAYYKMDMAQTEAILRPAVAYLDKDGKALDTMFDGFLFLLSGTFPSGGAGHNHHTASDFDANVKTLFKDGQNVMALESTVGKIKEELGLAADFKVPFYLSLYNASSEKYGLDVDGDGKDEDFTKIADRIKVQKYEIEKYEAELAAHDFKNIVFSGYYWYNESFNDAGGALEVTNAVSDMVHELGSQLFWIPYYQAPGYSLWKEHGMDVACMQSGCAFHLEKPIETQDMCAALVKKYGMCIEIEYNSAAGNNELYRDRYLNYLRRGVHDGYMTDCIHMYYLELSSFVVLAKSTKPALRKCYDYTYDFIKGKLEVSPEKAPDYSIEAQKNTIFEDKLKTENDTEYRKFKIASSPAHGTVTVNVDGTYSYYPDKDFTGVDTFSFAYSDLMDYSDPTVVTVNVK